MNWCALKAGQPVHGDGHVVQRVAVRQDPGGVLALLRHYIALDCTIAIFWPALSKKNPALGFPTAKSAAALWDHSYGTRRLRSARSEQRRGTTGCPLRKRMR